MNNEQETFVGTIRNIWNLLFGAFDGDVILMFLGILGIVLGIVYIVLEWFGDRIFKPRP